MLLKIVSFICAILCIGSTYSIGQPSWVNTAKLLPEPYLSNTTDQYGTSVSIFGNFAVVGAPEDHSIGPANGAAYVLEKTASGWEQIAKLKASDASPGMRFGLSVSISDNVIVVGAPFQGSDLGPNNMGGVYVFEMPTEGWMDMTETAKLSVTDSKSSDYVGFSVSVAHDQIAIGAFGHENHRGSVYVFAKPTSGWTDAVQTATLTPSDGVENDQFGISVGMSNNQIAIGSPGHDEHGDESGSVYVFVKPEGGWINTTETAKLTTSNALEGDNFGRNSISISNNTIVIGTNKQSAYVFSRSDLGWVNMTESAILTSSDTETGDEFGKYVQIDDDQIIVGAPGDDSYGSAYIYVKSSSDWKTTDTPTAKLSASDPDEKNYFGAAVGISNGNVIVGSYLDDDYGTYSGSCYLFEEPSSGWSDSKENVKIFPEPYLGNTEDQYGSAVDIDGEFGIVGTRAGRSTPEEVGAVYIIQKTTTGWQNIARLSPSDKTLVEHFGHTVALSGDVAVVGGSFFAKGEVWVFEQPKSGWTDMNETAILKASDYNEEDEFGLSLDISKDEIAIGSRAKENDDDHFGAIYVYERSQSAWADMTETAKLTASDNFNLGRSVAIFDGQVVGGGLTHDFP
ncbi:MAG: hypothetical protein RJQ14_12815, partial [Marinoscillum sp.]